MSPVEVGIENKIINPTSFKSQLIDKTRQDDLLQTAKTANCPVIWCKECSSGAASCWFECVEGFLDRSFLSPNNIFLSRAVGLQLV